MYGGEIGTDAARAACAWAGPAGKEAKAPIIISPGYLLGPAGGSRKKKKRVGEQK